MKNLKLIVALLIVTTFIPGSVSGANVATASEVSPIGQSGFSELSRCLNSNDVLDVYYMIDESSSLSSGPTAGAPGSDPNDDRATILASSIESLYGLRPGLKVNVGVATFAVNAREQRPWVELDEQTTPDLANWMRSEIPNLDQGNATNWEAALSFSQDQLARSSSNPTDRCQALVWFTDGSLNVNNDPEYDNLSDRKAMGDLCGVDHVLQEDFIARNGATVSEMRASGVTILGILLQDKNWDQVQIDYASLMRSIVEGEGATGTYASYTCGEVPIPPTSRPGALLIAKNPFDLAFQFQAIGQQANGGASVLEEGANPAKFSIDAGVASFKAVTTDPNWELTAPDDTKYNADSARNSGFQVTESSGAIQISRAVSEADLGEWEIFIPNIADNKREVYLFSGLGISLYATDFFSGEKGSISGTVLRELDGKPVDLGVYSDANKMSLSLVNSSGELLSPFSFPIDSDGTFELAEIDYPADREVVDMRLQLNLKTQSGIELAPVSFGKVIKITLRKDYPTVIGPIVMSQLLGSKPSVGIIELRGPESGSGQVCIGIPQVRDTDVNRAWKLDGDSSTWAVSQPAISNAGVSCVQLAQGESKTVEVSMQHSQSAESFVTGEIPMTLKPGDPALGSRKINEPIEFESLRAGSSEDRLFAEVLLTVLGVVIPLALLYGLTFFTTKFSGGTDLIRKQIPVDISSGGVRVREEGADVKFMPVAPMDDTRTFSDSSGLATMNARVSKLVFPAPWFEVAAKNGTRLVSFVAAPRSKAVDFESGKTVAIGLDVGKHSYFSINESDLVAGNNSDFVKANLVLYSRLGTNDASRLNDVLMMPGTWDRVSALKAKFLAESDSVGTSGKKDKSDKKTKSKSTDSVVASSVAAPSLLQGSSTPLETPSGIAGSNPSPPPPPGSAGSNGGSVPTPPPTPGTGSPTSSPPPPPGSSGGSVPPPPPV